jgi:pSer/pThr/pTyr-binding forkhead associated (FHA) protein
LQYAVGRGKENAIKCLSLYVSRKHCKFVQRGENLTIVDLSVSISLVVYYYIWNETRFDNCLLFFSSRNIFMLYKNKAVPVLNQLSTMP